MKKILFFIVLFISLKGFSQYPNGVQTIGNDSNVVQPKGALKGRIINFPYQDTTQANDQHIDEYAGAQIYTVTGDAFWLRDQTATRWIYLFRGSDTVFVSDDLYIDELLNPGYQTIRRYHNDGLVSGGVVTWTGTGLTFAISPAVYYINQVRYTTGADTITLDPADVTDGRVDVFTVDTTQSIGKITGTAAVNPVIPQHEPASQLVLATILLNAGDLTPSNLTINKIYDENIEWVTSSTGTAAEDFDDVVNPYTGTKDIFVDTYANNSKLLFTYAGTHTIGNSDVLSLRFYSNGAFLNKLRFQFFNTNTAASNSIQINSGFGLNPLDSNNYQFIDIPLSAFVFSPGVTGFNRLVITHVGSDLSGAKGYYLDAIQIQSGINNIPAPGDFSNKVDSVTEVAGSIYYWIKGIKHLVTAVGGGSITLTTTGTSGPATLVGSTLNIPQYSGGSGVTAAQVPLIINSGDSISRRWNVMDYVASGYVAGTTDATPAIQAALLACAAGGGGTVFFPNGVYKLTSPLVTSVPGHTSANPNSQIYIPVVDSSRDVLRTGIVLEGETPPNFVPNTYVAGATYTPSWKGVVLYSTITGSGVAPSVIGSASASPAYNNFNYQTLGIKNITITVSANPGAGGPTMGGLNFGRAVNAQIENFLYQIDASAVINGLPTHEIAGIIMPIANSEVNNTLRNVMVISAKYGIVVAEHSSMDQVSTWFNYAGFVFCGNTHPASGTRILTSSCINSLYFPASPLLGITSLINSNTYLNVANLVVEVQQGTGLWYDYNRIILDSSNLGRGVVSYHIVKSGVGVDNSLYNLYGGAYITGLAALNGTATYSFGQADGISLIGSNATRATLYTKATNTASAATSIWENDRSALTSYGSILYGGSANVASNLFGLSRADRLMIFTDGGSNLGMAIGTIGNQPLSLGTANNTRFRIGASGDWLIGGTAAGTSGQVFTSGGANAAPSWTTPGSGMAMGSTITGATSGSVLIAGAAGVMAQDNANFFWDATNHRLGIGKTGPASAIDIASSDLDVIRIVGSNPTRVTNYMQASNTASQVTFYFENNRGSFASYGGFLYGGATNATGNLFGVSRADKLFIFADGGSNLGMLIGTLSNQPLIFGTNNLARITVSNAGAVRMHTYGAGTATFDASGNITSVSDERFKNIKGFYKTGLKELMNLKPITYKWNKLSGNETDSTYAGFSAQNVKANIPYGTGTDGKGYLSLQDRAIIATLVNAVQEQQKQIEDLKKEIQSLKK